jgi:diguanylate cyclase (GGDEF)-like protein
MFDIDFFKKVNDAYGHLCGDYILKAVSSMIASVIRKDVDCLARYGGEEFCCLLPETGIDSAITVAERFRKVVMAMENEWDDTTVTITISLGVAALNARIQSSEHLLKEADDALYRAKKEGRNRVEVMV